MTDSEKIKKAVRERYGERAKNAKGCCGDSSDPISSDLYSTQELAWLPSDSNVFSFGCGNPTALAELRPGEVVLDLGSGAGLDVLLSARRVGSSGKAYGLDMTDEMLDAARRNQKRTGITNAEFLKGEMEDMPLPDGSVDVIISNCVVNLSPDKNRVLQEAFRVLKPGGRVAISDIVVRGEIPAALRHDMEAWAGCIAGALSDSEYRRLLEYAGFKDIDIEIVRTYSLEEVQGQGCWESISKLPVEQARDAVSRFTSSFVRASKPRS